MKALRLAIGGLIGLGALWWLADQTDLAAVAQAATAGGWAILALAVYRAVPQLLDAFAWRMAAAAAPVRPGMGWFFKARWIGEAVNTLLPVAQIGGDLLRARLLARRGAGGSAAGASVGVDFGLGLLTQALFVLLAAGLLAAVAADAAVGGLILGGLAATAAVAGLLLALRLGAVGKLSAVFGDRLAAGAAATNAALAAALADAARIAQAGAIKLAAWVARSGEIYLAALAIGEPVGVVAAIVIEAMANAARSLGFAIPGAIGAQEGGIVAAGALVGVSPEAALAIALLKRGREVVYSAPALLLWALEERRPAYEANPTP